MDTKLVFVRRQSPDWASLSSDFRAGRPIDPARFVPDHAIPGFPDDVATLIDHWNRRLSIDFFTFRAIVAAASSKNVRSIADAHVFYYQNIETILRFLRDCPSYVYFHDDDDFFSPDVTLVKRHFSDEVDAITTPLLRVGIPVFTFVKDGMDPDLVIGETTNFHFRFQTNNYAINGSRIDDRTNFLILKDHVLAASHAEKNGFSEKALGTLVSGTIKTPASASMLPGLLNDTAEIPAVFTEFLDSIAAVAFPSTCDWIAEPLGDIVRLTRNIVAGSGLEGVSDLLDF